jgi:hypothetical protein
VAAAPPPVLLDRIRRDPLECLVSDRFECLLTLYFGDHFTRAQMLTLFAIPPEMEADFDLFKTKFSSFQSTQAGIDDRQTWGVVLRACVKALQFGDITKAQFNTIAGLTLSTSSQAVIGMQS